MHTDDLFFDLTLFSLISSLSPLPNIHSTFSSAICSCTGKQSSGSALLPITILS